jgi:hypothetical protein
LIVIELVLDAEFPACPAARRRFEDSSGLACKELPAAIEEAHLGLYGLSLAVLAVFVLELCLAMIALGKKFFQHPLYIIDLVVVIASLVIEVWAHGRDESEAAAAVEILLLVR